VKHQPITVVFLIRGHLFDKTEITRHDPTPNTKGTEREGTIEA